ncbi:MAG: N-acetylglucosamine-6-phosphate deacetylase [Solirubrobacteraceae bacterium]
MIVVAPRVLTPEGFVDDAAVVIEGGRIAAVEPAGPADVVLDEGLLAPGLIDLQVNGAFGVDFATSLDWGAAARRLPETGVTSFLPTLVSAPIDDLVRGLRTPLRSAGARMLGVHVEGPFLTRAGAHDPACLCDPTPERLDALLEPGTMALLTLAPERPGALAAIGRAAAAGVVVSIGHSEATAEVVTAAADAGARMVTHLFNALGPGIASRALSDQRLFCGLIADGHHVSNAAVAAAFTDAPGRIALVSDGIEATGMPPGRYRLGRVPVTVEPGMPPVRDDGTLAGSVLRLDAAVAHAVAAGADPAAAIYAASRVPADVLQREDLGRIAPGARADLVWLGPGFEAGATWVGGEPVYGIALR